MFTFLKEAITRSRFRGYQSTPRAPNVVMRLKINREEVAQHLGSPLELENALPGATQIDFAVVTWRPMEPIKRWQNQSLDSILDKRDIEKVGCELRAIVMKLDSKRVFSVRLNEREAKLLNRSKISFCIVLMTFHSDDEVEIRAWHESRFYQALLSNDPLSSTTWGFLIAFALFTGGMCFQVPIMQTVVATLMVLGFIARKEWREHTRSEAAMHIDHSH